MPKQDPENTILTMILDGQKEVREDLREVRDDIKELAVSVSTHGANFSNISNQMDRVLNTITLHGNLLAEHAERFSSLEASQEAYYRYKKQPINSLDSNSESISPKSVNKNFFNFPPKSTSDTLKFLFVSLLSASAIVGGILKALGILEF